MKKTKVLIITYYWPPSGGPGVQRWLKFAKYLPEYDIEPIVITPSPEKAEYPIIDESLEKEISPDLEVHKTDNSSFYDIYKKFTKAKTAPYSGFANESKPGLKQKISRFVRGNFFLPDSRKGWNKFAYAKACELIEKYDIKTVITTSPPHSIQLTGLRLKQKYNIQWIADFRDPWTDIFYYKDFYPTYLARKIDSRYERKVLENADTVIAVGESDKKLFVDKSSLIDEKKIKIIHNGYDEEDFDFDVEAEDDIFTISYMGTLPAGYNISSFIEAAKSIISDRKLRIRFVGKVDKTIETRLTQELADSVEFLGFVPHKEAIAYLKKASMLLMVLPENEDKLLGKLFEYIGSGKPIICIGHKNGAAASLIKEAKSGKSFAFDDKKAIEEYIIKEYEESRNKERNTNSNIRLFSRRYLSKQLASIILNH